MTTPPCVIAACGVGGYVQYRIPAMAVTTTGRILVVYDARPDIDDLPSPIDLVMRASDDNGDTWSEQCVVRTGDGFAGFGDASLLVDADTGRIFLMHAATQLAGFFESTAGTGDDDPHVQHADLGYSDDDGETWTFRRITRQLKRAPITGLFAASGQGAQIFAGRYAGRLLQPYVVRQNDMISAAVAYSDDHGDTWQLGEIVGPGTNEATVVPLPDGTVLLNSRSTPHRLVAASRDGGVTFGGLHRDTALPDPGDNGSAIRLDGRPTLRTFPNEPAALLCAHNHDTDMRRNLVIKYSPDNGSSWTRRYTVYSGSAGYSVLCRLADGAIGVFYEKEGYTRLVFQRVSLDDFVANADETPPPTLDLDAVLRFVRRREPDLSASRDSGHEIPLGDAAKWSPAEWREIGQSNTADTVQTIYPRADRPGSAGRPSWGLAAGDELRLTARVRNGGAVTARSLRLTGTFDDADNADPADLLQGERRVFRAIRRRVTDEDVARGFVEIALHAAATVAAVPVSVSATYRYSTHTALPIEPPKGQS